MTPETNQTTESTPEKLTLPPVPPPPANAVILIGKARDVAITTPREYILACEAKLQLDEIIKEREAVHGKVKTMAWELHKAASEAFNLELNPLYEAKRLLANALDGWRREQERLAEEQRRRDQEALDRAAEAEREEEVQAAEAAGATVEEVTQIIERPVYVPPVVAPARPAAVPKVAGIRKKADNWKAMLDPAKPDALGELIRYCAANPQFQYLLQLNERSASGLAKGQRDKMNIPGLRSYNAAL